MIKNWILLYLWQLLALFPVPARTARENEAVNRQCLQRLEQVCAEGFLEDQDSLRGLRFGNGYDFAYNGCSVIAVYNALHALREPVNAEVLLRTVQALQKKGAAWQGKYGVSPLALKRYWKRSGYQVRTCLGADPAQLNRLGEASETVLAVVWNGGRLRDQFHAVNIEKRNGGYIIHNTYYFIRESNGAQTYMEKGPFGSLSEAIAQTTDKGARPALVLGICHATEKRRQA